MTRSESPLIHQLLERLARLAAAEEWTDDLNPAQIAALRYLDRANRFSRSPYQVAEYLSATRGTVSQTLRALARKGLVEEHASAEDRRRIAYDVTAKGRAALGGGGPLSGAIDALPAPQAADLEEALTGLLRDAIARSGGRPFGVCRTCRHHIDRSGGRFCALLEVALSGEDAERICYEHA